ncbi:MAG: acetylglutamate kinase [Gammaproteobacteria bacterium]|nr:acetylglutamate kinase [Gammaproteobacteria bacterium]
MEKENKTKAARVLTEALPYIQKFHGSTFIIKYGGNAMVEEGLKNNFARDIVLMKLVGLNPIVVHGGGPQIGTLLDRLNIPSKFVAGMRVTNSETMDVVEMVLGGLVNQEIVSLINKNGGKAVGITGKDGDLITARKLEVNEASNELKASEIIDIGQVGEVEKVNAEVLNTLIEQNFIPVVAPIGVGAEGESYNINADLVAGRLAAELHAEKLILITNTPGILDEKGETIPNLTIPELDNLILQGVIKEGMLPKAQCAKTAVAQGVRSAQIIDGTLPNSLLLEIFTDEGIGTQVIDA